MCGMLSWQLMQAAQHQAHVQEHSTQPIGKHQWAATALRATWHNPQSMASLTATNACGHASAFPCRHRPSLLHLPLPCLPLHARGQGYDAYIAVFYAVSAVILVSLALTVWVAVILKKDDSGNAWLRR